MTGVLMAIMVVLVALVVDIGHTRLVQRQLQAGVDAAALAGAQDLPIASEAISTAYQYSPTPGDKNSVNTVDNATTTAVARCIPSIPGCNTRYATVNAVSVTSTSKVPTFFARIIGVKSLTVSAKATACFPCSVRPLDIMIVLDRTGSMCQGGPGQRQLDPAEVPRPRRSARRREDVPLADGSEARPGRARGLAARGRAARLEHSRRTTVPAVEERPPTHGRELHAVDPGTGQEPDTPQNVCSKPAQNPFYFGYNAYAPYWKAETDPSYTNGDRSFYVVSSLSDDDVDNNPSDDYVVKDAQGQWDLNNSAPIVSTLDCVQAAGSTSYSLAIDEAAHELQIHGRPDVQDVIVFFTDGGANTFPNKQATGWPSAGSPWNRPSLRIRRRGGEARSGGHGDLHDRLRPREPDHAVTAVPEAGLERPAGQQPAGRGAAVVGEDARRTRSRRWRRRPTTSTTRRTRSALRLLFARVAG